MIARVTSYTPMVILKDNSQIAMKVYTTVYQNLSALVKKRSQYFALFELVQKCLYNKHALHEDAKIILQKHKLLQEDGTLHPDVIQIVLNSINVPAVPVKLSCPLKSNQIFRLRLLVQKNGDAHRIQNFDWLQRFQILKLFE